MPGDWKTVRVFISSTFRDMHAERDHLVKVVFPALRELLEKHRIYLVDIDLRWGVTREQAENDQALDLCLQQIDECRPFFIGILGERYGWVPTRHPADALKKFGWIQQHTGKSITELEILHGVLQDSAMRGRAFFYFRDTHCLKAIPEAIRRGVYAETETDQVERLAALKKKIRYSGYPVMENYPARWDPEAYDRPSRSQGRLVDLDDFGQRVHGQLWQAIQEEFQLPEQPPAVPAADLLAEEQDYHERFMESRLRVYVGREQINDVLLGFADGNDVVPCLLTGPSGSGKSAALARFVRDYQHKQPQTLVIPHFIGASPRSTNLREMLRRFCQVFKARFGFAEDVPEEVAKLSVAFREFVAKVPAETRVLQVIDALNQLDEVDRAQELYWLPTAMPPHVKVIVSCITDSGKTEPVLKAFGGRKHCPVQLAALSDAEQRLIIHQVPSLSAKTLDDDQVRLLLSNPATANPLFLLVALEELRGFAPYERLNERIAAFPRVGDTVTAIFTQVIEQLGEEFNQKLVETILTLLASARRGLSERELQELVAGLEGADDLFPVLRQLRPYLLSRAGLIDFYHRNLFNAVHERYLAAEEQRRLAHACLAEYFDGQDYWGESLEEQRRRAKTLPPTPRPANVRKVDELPWQLLQAADWKKSEELLTDLAFLEAKAEAGMVFDLAGDFTAAVGGMPADRRLLRILRLLDEAILRDIHFLARHPTTMFQCLWNSCWWYDTPQAKNHYDLSSGKGQGPAPWTLPLEERLSTLLEAWRADRERAKPGFLWLRSLRPPSMHLGSGQKAVLRGHESFVSSVAWSGDGRRILSGAFDNTVRVWDAATGQELLCMRGHVFGAMSVAWNGDGRRIVSSAADRTVRVWDASTGKEVLCLRGHEDRVTSVAWSCDGYRIASGSEDKTVRVWDAATGQELLARGDEGRVSSVAWSGDGCRIVSGSDDQTVRVWEAATGHELLCLRGHESWVTSVAWSSDSRRVVSGAHDHTVRVWDAATGQELLCLRGHEGWVMSVALSSDGRRIVSGSDQTVRVWDAATGQELLCLRGHENLVTSVAWSGDGRHILSGSQDKTLRLWDVTTDQKLLCLHGYDLWVSSVAWSNDGQRIVSGSYDKTVRVWDAATGQELLCLRGHERGVTSVGWRGDDRRIVSGSEDHKVRVWDGATGQELLCLCGHDHVRSVAWNGDGRRIVSGSADGTVRVWDAATGQELLCMRGHEHLVVNSVAWMHGKYLVSSVAWSCDGRRIASGSWDKTVRVWDATTGQEILCLCGHEEPVTSVAWSGDDRRIVSASKDQAVRVWDGVTGKCLHQYQGAGNAEAFAQEQIPIIAIVQSIETVFQDRGSHCPIGWLAGRLEPLAVHPSGRAWTGRNDNHLCLVRLEGSGRPDGIPTDPVQ